MKKNIFFLGALVLFCGIANAENKEITKLDETFAHFLDEQKAQAADETKMEVDAANIVTSEETAMKKKEMPPADSMKKESGEMKKKETCPADKKKESCPVEMKKQERRKECPPAEMKKKEKAKESCPVKKNTCPK